MDVVVLTADLEEEWERFVETSPHATFAHLLGWRNVVTRTYHHTPYYLVAREAGQVMGILPLFLICSRFFGRFLVTAPYLSHGGLLATTGEAAVGLVQAAKEVARREQARYMEIRGCERIGHGLVLNDKYCTYLLALAPDPLSVWGRLERRGRKAVRKALKSGLTLETGPNLIAVFDAVMGQQKRELGTPFHWYPFYRHLLEEFPKQTEVLMVRREKDYVGGMLLVTFRKTVLPLYGGGLAREKHISPMTLLFWETICYACKNGYSCVDWGRSQWGSGTALFKRQWGAEPVPMFYEYHLADGTSMPDVYPTNPKFRLAIGTWKLLPFFVTRVVGPWIARDIP